MEPMIEALEAGLPVDLAQVSTKKFLFSFFVVGNVMKTSRI